MQNMTHRRKYVCKPVYNFGVCVTDEKRFFLQTANNRNCMLRYRQSWLLLSRQSLNFQMPLVGMNYSSSDEFINLPMNLKQYNHQSNKCIGLHVFFCAFFDSKSQSEEVHKGIVFHLLYKSEGVNPDEDYVKSLDIEVTINHISEIRLSCSSWRSLLPQTDNFKSLK